MPANIAVHRNIIMGTNFKIAYTFFNILGDFDNGNCKEDITWY